MPGSLQAHHGTTSTSAVLPTAPEDESAGSGARRLSQCPPVVAAKLANSLACTSLENLYSLYSSCSLQFSSPQMLPLPTGCPLPPLHHSPNPRCPVEAQLSPDNYASALVCLCHDMVGLLPSKSTEAYTSVSPVASYSMVLSSDTGWKAYVLEFFSKPLTLSGILQSATNTLYNRL